MERKLNHSEITTSMELNSNKHYQSNSSIIINFTNLIIWF